MLHQYNGSSFGWWAAESRSTPIYSLCFIGMTLKRKEKGKLIHFIVY